MFVHKVREFDVLWFYSIRVKVVTPLLCVNVHDDPMFPGLIAVVGVAHESSRVCVDGFW